jgi:3-oxoacyl-[acyl-carrier protein] reductase
MDLGLRDRAALVLGASSGLGLAAAEALRAEGADVVMVARRTGLLREHARRLGATPVTADVRDPADVQRAVTEAVAAYGGLDVVVLNGGGPPAGSATSVDLARAHAAFELLFLPAIAVIDAALPHLRASSQGRIISISSMSVHEPIGNLALSNAIRPGVWGYLKTLASELAADGITVNSVGPGRIATDRLMQLYTEADLQTELNAIPACRLGEPREIGDVVCFLASRQASYITGAHLNVDGGLTRAL